MKILIQYWRKVDVNEKAYHFYKAQAEINNFAAKAENGDVYVLEVWT